jgi:hypothetical protein
MVTWPLLQDLLDGPIYPHMTSSKINLLACSNPKPLPIPQIQLLLQTDPPLPAFNQVTTDCSHQRGATGTDASELGDALMVHFTMYSIEPLSN